MMNRLFLVCPDCYMEQPIREKFGENSFFLTALGTAFDLSEFKLMEEINQFIRREDVKEIYLVNDSQCTFIKSALANEVRFDTKAEKILLDICNSDDLIKDIRDQELKSKKISESNVYRLAYELMESAILGMKISEGEINLKGLIYNRKDKTFQTLRLDLNA
ncbi:MAG: hypothetical protein JKX68_01535 [Flavobacteriales bacterium]|nr:hypothetical protein [Flavobacteriales bacterium]